MRYTEIWINERNVVNNKSPHDPTIRIMVDGQPVQVGELPKAICEKEPEEIGSQVRAVCNQHTAPLLFTKVSHNQWQAFYWADSSGKANGFICSWEQLSVKQVIRPEPEPEKLEEPQGLGAVIEADCPRCKEHEVLLVKDMGVWMCQDCMTGSNWSEFEPETVIVIQKGHDVATA